MFRYLFILLIFVNISYAQAKRYFIQLGAFQDQRLLEHNIAQMPSSLRSHIVVVKSNSWLIPFAYHTPNRRALAQKINDYKRYFPDAIISSSSYLLSHRVVLNYVKQKTYTKKRQNFPKIVYHQVPKYRQAYQNEQYISPEPSIVYHPEVIKRREEVYAKEEDIITPIFDEDISYTRSINAIEEEIATPMVASIPIVTSIPMDIPVPTVYNKTPIPMTTVPIPTPRVITHTSDIERYHHFSSNMLSGQTYYLAYKATQSNPNLLIKVKFGTHSVSYQPIIGDMQMADAHYIVDKKRLYMYADNFSENGAYSKIESQRIDHILVSSWAGGKKLNTLRYYFRIGDAKQYLNIEQSEDKLSEAIEEGLDYDWELDL